jgi:hypothetical protein
MLDGRHGFSANDNCDNTPSRTDPSNTTDTHAPPTAIRADATSTRSLSARVGTHHGRTFGSQ